MHRAGLEAKNLLNQCRLKVAKTFGMPKFSEDRIIFTSSGTEANNIAMVGCAKSKKRDLSAPGTIIISAGEHPSISEPAAMLEREGYDVVRIPTSGGVLDLEYLRTALEKVKSPVIFAGFMLVNNETGAIYDVKSASAIVKAKFPDANIHCDAVQGYLKLKFTPHSIVADTVAVSAHKINSYRGAGALYVSGSVIKRKNITAVMPGGGQEFGYRSGTENLCAISAFAAAAEEGYANFNIRADKLNRLRAKLNAEYEEKLRPLGVKVNLPERCLDGIMNISLPSIRSETMLNYLSGRDIYVSAGSACAANSKKKSAALEAFGCTEDEMDCAVRISMGGCNEEEDVEVLCDALAEGIRTLQKKR